MKCFKSCGIIFMLFASFIIFSCGGGGGSNSGEVGTISMSLTDAMSNEFKAVYVTIEDVQVHNDVWEDGNWESVSAPNLPKTFNLYDLTNGVREEIGLADIEAGTYTQMRLIIATVPDNGINELDEAHPFANYVIDTDDNYHDLKIPSGIQTGIKIVHGFNISNGQTTELLLDFNAEKSVIVAGNSGNWLLKPTIKIADIEELSIIRGRVVEKEDGTIGIPGALVSVQGFDGTAEDEKDKVTIHTSTITDDSGNFAIFIYPLEAEEVYNLVITSEEKLPAYQKIDALEEGETLIIDPAIQLENAVVKNVTGDVIIPGGGTSEQFASLSFRQDIGTGEMIEVSSVSVLNLENFDINLPLETYSIVAWTTGFDTRTYKLEISESDDEPIIQDIEFVTY